MAILSRIKPAPPPVITESAPMVAAASDGAWPAVRPLTEVPVFAEAAGLLSALRERKERAEAEIQRVNLEAKFARRTAPASDRETARNRRYTVIESDPDAALWTRLEGLRKLPPYFPASDAEAGAGNSALARAQAVLDGGKAPPPADSAALVAQLRRDIEALEAGIAEQHDVVEQLRDDFSIELSNALAQTHGAKMVELFHACRHVAALVQDMHEFWGGITATGYNPRGHIVPAPEVNCILHFGHEGQHASQISVFRRQLIARGLLK